MNHDFFVSKRNSVLVLWGWVLVLGWAMALQGCGDSGSQGSGSSSQEKTQGAFPADWDQALSGKIPQNQIPEDLEDWMNDIDVHAFDLEDEIVKEDQAAAVDKLTKVVWMLRASEGLVDKPGYADENRRVVGEFAKIHPPLASGQFEEAKKIYFEAFDQCEVCHEKYREDS